MQLIMKNAFSSLFLICLLENFCVTPMYFQLARTFARTAKQGVRALPVLKKYFQGLINRLEKECDVEEGSSILDWLPNVAIVTGPMSLTLPRH